MIRTTRPGAGNKYYITRSAGGYSTCIVGKPTDKWCNALSNCVGYANGAANEELDLGYEKYHLNCNAENFIERAIASGLSVYKTPQVGDIICWEGKGSLAGHVGIVIEVINSNCIRVAQSGYGNSNPFWITTNYNNNGRWGLSGNYPFRGFIRILNNPEPIPKPTPGPSDKFNIGDKVIINGPLYANANATTPSGSTGDRETVITRKAAGTAHPYNTTGDLGWMDESSIKAVQPEPPKPEPTPEPPKPEPTPISYKFKVGDKVVINGSLYVSSTASNASGSVSNKVTTITRLAQGTAHPYNTAGDLGWMNESDIKAYTEEAPATTPFRVGDKVVPTKLVDYNGTSLRQYDSYYTISQINGDRAVLTARGQVWAAMNTANIRHY